MEIQDIITKIYQKAKEIRELENEMMELRKEVVELAEFKKGDKVKVTTTSWSGKEDSAMCIISSVMCKESQDDPIVYRFNKVKKDGTMANVSAGIWGKISKIEKVN